MMTRSGLCLILLAGLLFSTACEPPERQRPVLQYDRQNPAANSSRYPHLFTPDGHTLYMSWMTRIEEGMNAIQYSRYRDGRWESPRSIHVGNDIHLSWSERPELLLLDDERPVSRWIRLLDTTPRRYQARVAIPADRYWDHIMPHEESPALRSGLSMEVVDQDRILVWWNEQPLGAEAVSGQAGTRLRSALIHSDGTVSARQTLHEESFGCGSGTISSLNGVPVGVYRTWDGEEHSLSLVRWDQQAESWQEWATLGGGSWDDPECPVGAPALYDIGDELAVVWYAPADDGQGAVHAATIRSGESAGQTVEVASGTPAQRVAVAAGPDDRYHIVWMERRGAFADIWLQRMSGGELQEDPIRLGATDAGKVSGSPALAAMDHALVVAWTQTEPFFRVRTVHIPWSATPPAE